MGGAGRPAAYRNFPFGRQRDSFAKVALIAGNSEVMIRRHYLGRVTKEETARFFAVLPGANIEIQD